MQRKEGQPEESPIRSYKCQATAERVGLFVVGILWLSTPTSGGVYSRAISGHLFLRVSPNRVLGLEVP